MNFESQNTVALISLDNAVSNLPVGVTYNIPANQIVAVKKAFEAAGLRRARVGGLL